MSIFKVLEGNITKEAENYSEYISDMNGDALRGAEFMFYALSKIFKDKTIEEIEKGMVDSSYRKEKYDFGIDAIYITGSKDFIETNEQLEDYGGDTKFAIHIFQFKRGTGIAQADLLKFKKGLEKVLINEDLKDTDNLYFYNRMIELNEIKTSIYNNYSTDNIKVICHIVFGGIEANILKDQIVSDELTSIKELLNNNGFTNSEIKITDCKNLINSFSKSEEIIDIIEYEKTLKYITGADKKDKLNGYICIIKGREIAELVRKHQTSIFEANIRDYYKRSDLNSKITKTSSSEE